MDQPALTEAYFLFGWMHVDIDQRRIDIKEEHECRVATVKEYIRIRLPYRVRNQPVADQTTVDMKILLIGLRTRCGRKTDPTVQ